MRGKWNVEIVNAIIKKKELGQNQLLRVCNENWYRKLWDVTLKHEGREKNTHVNTYTPQENLKTLNGEFVASFTLEIECSRQVR